MSPHRTPPIDTAAIYAARNHRQLRADLPAERSAFCATECFAQGDPNLCDATTSCWATRIGATTRGLAQQRLQLERGRTPAPRPRSVADVARDYWATRAARRPGALIPTSARGGRS